MAEHLEILQGAGKAEQYENIMPQIKGLIEGETDMIANMANISAVLKEAFGVLWVGFYLVKEGQLVLGPFQGPIACTRIAFSRGVCGACYTRKETVIVPDVEAFPGHIACSSAAKSEIVVPVFGRDQEIIAVLDVDSDSFATFDDTDKLFLEQVCALIAG